MSRTTLLSVAVLSAAILAYEVLLVRIYAIVGWHHFAYMIISIALLGFGAGGTVLALAQRWLLPRFAGAYAAGAVLFAAAAVLSLAAALRLPFNPLAIVWDLRQPLWLGLSYLCLVLPFLFGGGAIGLALVRFSAEVGRVYAFDLAGAGAGALGVIGLLFLLSPEETLRAVAAMGLLAAALAVWRHRAAAAALAAAALGVALWLPPALTDPRPHVSQYKGLPLALRAPEARVVAERSGPLGLVSVVDSPVIPFRHVPGLSLNNLDEPPPQLGVFTDADAMTAITRWDGDPAALRYLDQTTAALPYHLLDRPSVLVLGAGGGEQVLLALHHAARRIEAVELNPQLGQLVTARYADYAGNPYARPEVALRIAEARSFVERTPRLYDLVQLPLAGPGGAAAGVQSLHEDYTHTLEALDAYLRHLRPGGLLAATLWLKLPPRDSLKLFATAIEVLERQGVARPADRLAMIRSWNTVTLLVKNGALTAADIRRLRDFAAARSFDLAWHPGMTAAEANRHNILARPWFFEGAEALAGPGRAEFIARYKFAIRPATDDRPYFHDFFRWRSLPELLALGPQGAAALLDMGYLILFATLVQAAALSAALILAPLALGGPAFRGPGRGPVAAYFLAIGLGFLFVEIACIQRFGLFLGHPLYAVAVVLAGFLVFAGAGSALAPRLDRWLAGRRPGAIAVAGIAVALLTLAYAALLPPLLGWLIWLPAWAKVPLALALIAPLAGFMGMPFPLGLARVARQSPALVPWAWAINGCASVIAAILAALLAIHAGFAAVMALAALLYLTIPLALGGDGPPARATLPRES